MQKIRHAQSRSTLVHQWLSEKELATDLKTMLAIHKAFQEIVEVMLDLVAMMLKDVSVPPLDDYTNIKQAVTNHLLPSDAESILREANGLRNRLIHVYNSIDSTLVSQRIDGLLPQLDKYLGVIERWVHQTRPR